MVTGCMIANGMYVGPKTTLGTSKFGNYISYENQHIKAWLKAWWQTHGTNGTPAEPNHDILAGFHIFLEAIFEGFESWGFKTIPELWPFFEKYEPVVVCVRRKYENAIASAMDKGKGTITEAEVHVMVQERMALMGELVSRGGHWVDSDRVVAGDFEQIEKACLAGGLEFDEQATSRVIEPNRWHFK